jgi:hypothetical protein
MAVIGDTALLLERFGGTGLVSLDEVVLAGFIGVVAMT